MRKKIRSIGLAAAALTIALSLPVHAQAAPDTGWLQSNKLYEIRTWAGQPQWGHENGPVENAAFLQPQSIAELPDGRLLVADTGNHLLRVVSAGEVAAYSGMTLGEDESGSPIGAYYDDERETAFYQQPSGLAVDVQGNVYVADTGNHAIRKITTDGKVTTLAGNGRIGNADGQGKEATFHSPSDVAVDSRGNVYVADTLNHTIRKITKDGAVVTLTAPSERVVEYFPGAVEPAGDYADGALSLAKFNEPSGLALDAKDNLYVSDRGNQRIRYIDFAAGTVTTVAGGEAPRDGASIYAPGSAYAQGDYVDGAAAAARFNAPEGLTVTPDGALIVADSLNHVIRAVKAGKVSTLAGVPVEFGTVDGVPGSAQFNRPTDVALLADGRLAIADESGHKVRILQKYAQLVSLPSDERIHVILNGKSVVFDAPARLKANAVLLPVRSMGVALGYEVGYDKKTGAATLSRNGIKYAIKSGRSTVDKTVDGLTETLTLNAPAANAGNRMFIPVRFFAEESGLDVQWDAAAGTVVIRNPVFN